MASQDSEPGGARKSSSIRRHWAIALACALLAFFGVIALVIYTGLYNIAADVPHTQFVYSLLETLRERSIEVRARDVVVPGDLGDPSRPGMKRTEIARGLYPRRYSGA